MAIVDVVKCEVSNSELVNKFPSDKIRLGSQLVVYPGQTAIFVKGGKLYDEFTCGTYTIKTENIPLLDKVVNLPFGGDSPFQAEVWFVNQISLLDCKWGTLTPLQIEDPKYDVIVPVRAFGQYGFKIEQPRTFLEKLVGNMPSFATDKVVSYFRGIILSKLTAIIYDKLKEEGLSVLNINSQVEVLSEYAKDCLKNVFLKYGIGIEIFNIISITVKEDDPSFLNLKDAKDAAAEIKIMGEKNYRLSRSFDVLDAAAENESGGAMNAALGLGAGVGIGGAVGTMAAKTFSNSLASDDVPPPLPKTTSYYLGIQGKQIGPMEFDSVCKKYSSNEINADTLVWKKGLKSWIKISDMEDFKHLFENECPPPLPSL